MYRFASGSSFRFRKPIKKVFQDKGLFARSIMKTIARTTGLLICVLLGGKVSARSIDMSVSNKFAYCAFVAEVRVTAVDKRFRDDFKMPEWLLTCVVEQKFRCPSPHNTYEIPVLIHNDDVEYLNKEFTIFAFCRDGKELRPFGTQSGLLEKGSNYYDRVTGILYSYEELHKTLSRLASAPSINAALVSMPVFEAEHYLRYQSLIDMTTYDDIVGRFGTPSGTSQGTVARSATESAVCKTLSYKVRDGIAQVHFLVKSSTEPGEFPLYHIGEQYLIGGQYLNDDLIIELK